MKSLYDILGVSKDAKPEEIKKAYHDKAKANHPDKPDGDNDSMQDVNRAYAVLKNPTTRKVYDEDGEDAATATRKDKAIQYAMQISAQLIAENPSDIPRAINNLLEAWKRSYTYGRKQKDREKRGILAFKDRIINTPQYDVLSMVIDQSISTLNDDLKGIDDDFEDRMNAFKFLDQYTFSNEEEEQDAPYGTSVTGTFVTA